MYSFLPSLRHFVVYATKVKKKGLPYCIFKILYIALRMFNQKIKKMKNVNEGPVKDKVIKILNWIITIATAAVVFIDKLPF